MLRQSWRRAGSYILCERLVPDWWQPFYREDVHQRAKDRLKDALALVEASSGAVPAEALDRVEGPSLYEMNALIATFTAAHNVEDLSATLQYVHEQLGQELTPFHYHALLRTFSYQYDRDSAVQLLTVMAQRGDMTAETYARVMDMLHCLSPPDVQERLLRVITLTEDAFGTLLHGLNTAGSERATARAFAPAGEVSENAIADLNVMPGEAHSPVPGNNSAAASGQRQEAPVLTSLLNHVVNSGTYSPIAALLVVVWMRALGATLGDWDVALVLSSLLAKPEDFPRVRSVTGYFASTPRGFVRPREFLDRLAERGERTPASAPLSALATAMEASLRRARVDMNRPVWVGVVNAQTTGLPALIEQTLTRTGTHKSYTAVGSADAMEEGYTGCEAAQVYHYVMLLHATMKSYTAAVQMLASALARDASATSTKRRAESEEEVGPADEASDGGGEVLFKVDCHFLMDAGAVLPWTSVRHRAAIADAYRHAVRRVAQDAREDALRAATVSAAVPTSAADLAALVTTLAAPPRQPSLIDATNCEGYSLLFLRTAAEAREALAHLLDSIEPGTARLHRTTRFTFRQLVHFCVQHPRVNSKMTATGLAERLKWARYLDARDTALNLFGSAQQARDMMRQLFYDEATMPALRSAEVVARDMADMTKILFPGLVAEAASQSSSSSVLASPTRSTSAPTASVTEDASTECPPQTEEKSLSVVEATALMVQSTIIDPRSTLPHVRCDAHVVPRCLYDPEVYNPYPQTMLSMPTGTSSELDLKTDVEGDDDFFAELWKAVVNPSTCGHGDLHWYVQDTDMFLLLLRCLVHRLDWEAAVHLTTKMVEYNTYTHRMDHEITRMFQEAGDPAGFLAFKVATKLFDGRILRDGQGRRGHDDPVEAASERST